MSKSPKLGLPDDAPIPRRADGLWDVSRSQLRLLALLHDHDWLRHPRYSEIEHRHYLRVVTHKLYFVPDQVTELLAEELEEQERCRLYEPSVTYLRRLARAALEADEELRQIISASTRDDSKKGATVSNRTRPRSPAPRRT